ncbi:helix-turn-helix domain-containing protein [Candidatus Kaiserbacteria bacterium]|nr:helix-turn-helix domain-containing protein [Candidatus Kaiserbacteria bacterium]MCB9811787.1 helix-turn-helix domain-containing protein [Candidatus Nomurabacteria bacterium]
MVRLNKGHLSQKQLDQLFEQLTKSIADYGSQQSHNVLAELLGQDERIMIAKRLAAVILLTEGTSMYKVAQILKLSRSTVKNLYNKLERGGFDYTLKKVSRTKKDYFVFLNTLDNILHLGGILPHYNGPERFKNL